MWKLLTDAQNIGRVCVCFVDSLWFHRVVACGGVVSGKYECDRRWNNTIWNKLRVDCFSFLFVWTENGIKLQKKTKKREKSKQNKTQNQTEVGEYSNEWMCTVGRSVMHCTLPLDARNCAEWGREWRENINTTPHSCGKFDLRNSHLNLEIECSASAVSLRLALCLSGSLSYTNTSKLHLLRTFYVRFGRIIFILIFRFGVSMWVPILPNSNCSTKCILWYDEHNIHYGPLE